MDINRELPQDADCEKAVLHLLLNSTSSSSSVIFSKIVKDDFFYDSRHKLIFAVSKYLYDANKGIDIISVSARLREIRRHDQAGGSVYLTELAADPVASMGNFGQYVEILRDKMHSRALIVIFQRNLELMFEPMTKPTAIMDTVSQNLFDLRMKDDQGFTRLNEIVVDLMDDLNTAIDQNKTLGIPSGYHDIDRITGGFYPQDLWYIGARPSIGKTSLALCMAHKLALEQGKSSAFFSLEMAKRSLAMRTLGDLAKQNVYQLRTLQGYTRDKLKMAMGKISVKLEGLGRVYIDDKANITTQEMAVKIRKLKNTVPDLAVVFVDYLQIIPSRGRGMYEDTTALSGEMKALAKNLDVTVVCLSQLSRKVEQREDKTPELGDLKDSGAIEQDADIVLLLYRPDFYFKEVRPGECDAIIAKHRNGPTGIITLGFQKDHSRFVNLQKPNPELPF